MSSDQVTNGMLLGPQPAILYISPYGVDVSPIGINIQPVLISITPFMDSISPAGVSVAPSLITVSLPSSSPISSSSTSACKHRALHHLQAAWVAHSLQQKRLYACQSATVSCILVVH